MTWTKLSDDFGDETWRLTHPAHRLLIDLLLWSNRKLLDLRIPKDDLRRFAKCPESIDELLAGGWVTDEGDHYLIVFHGRYQETREQVIARQKRSQENGKKGGRPPKPGRERAPHITQHLTQTETHVGSDEDSEEPQKTQQLARVGTQKETHRETQKDGLNTKQPSQERNGADDSSESDDTSGVRIDSWPDVEIGIEAEAEAELLCIHGYVVAECWRECGEVPA